MVEIFGGFDRLNHPVERLNHPVERLNHPVERLNQCELVRPVQMEKGTSSSDIARVYKKWVIKEKAEGLVVHTEQPVIWKIKPLHSIDAAVIGYTSYEKGVRELLFAVMEPSGIYRIFASGSNGLSDKQRKILEVNLSALKVSSNLIYTDS